MHYPSVILILALVLGQIFSPSARAESAPMWSAPSGERPALDVPYVPTPHEVVNSMLSIAGVNSDDTLYDLGCGDGRIVVTAARERKVRKAVGIDLDPERIRESRENASKAGVDRKVSFRQQNLFDVDISDATVVSMYLLPSVNLKLRPRLLRTLRPGTRLVSHDFDMGDWQPDRTVELSGHTVYFWVVPANVRGIWKWDLREGGKTRRYELALDQQYQNVTAELKVDGAARKIESVGLKGDRLEFTASGGSNGQTGPLRFEARLQGNDLKGSVSAAGTSGGPAAWKAERDPATTGPIDTENAVQVTL